MARPSTDLASIPTWAESMEDVLLHARAARSLLPSVNVRGVGCDDAEPVVPVQIGHSFFPFITSASLTTRSSSVPVVIVDGDVYVKGVVSASDLADVSVDPVTVTVGKGPGRARVSRANVGLATPAAGCSVGARGYIFRGDLKHVAVGEIEEVLLPKRPPLFSCDEDLNSRVSLYYGDATRLRLDAIVNAANTRLMPGGGICGAIFRAAGLGDLLAECRAAGGHCETGHTVATPGCALPSKWVLHTVGPVGENAELLRSSYRTTLSEMVRVGAKSVALCCVSTGIYGYAPARAAPVALRAVREWLEEHVPVSGADDGDGETAGSGDAPARVASADEELSTEQDPPHLRASVGQGQGTGKDAVAVGEDRGLKRARSGDAACEESAAAEEGGSHAADADTDVGAEQTSGAAGVTSVTAAQAVTLEGGEGAALGDSPRRASARAGAAAADAPGSSVAREKDACVPAAAAGSGTDMAHGGQARLQRNADLVDRVVFCIFDEENFEVYQREMPRYFPHSVQAPPFTRHTGK